MRIDHAALFCRDLEQMRQFFIDYFDARSNEQYHNPRTGPRTTGDGYYESTILGPEGIQIEVTE